MKLSPLMIILMVLMVLGIVLMLIGRDQNTTLTVIGAVLMIVSGFIIRLQRWRRR